MFKVAVRGPRLRRQACVLLTVGRLPRLLPEAGVKAAAAVKAAAKNASATKIAVVGKTPSPHPKAAAAAKAAATA